MFPYVTINIYNIMLLFYLFKNTALYIYMFASASICICMHGYTHVHVHVHIHMYIYIYRYVYVYGIYMRYLRNSCASWMTKKVLNE